MPLLDAPSGHRVLPPSQSQDSGVQSRGGGAGDRHPAVWVVGAGGHGALGLGQPSPPDPPEERASRGAALRTGCRPPGVVPACDLREAGQGDSTGHHVIDGTGCLPSEASDLKFLLGAGGSFLPVSSAGHRPWLWWGRGWRSGCYDFPGPPAMQGEPFWAVPGLCLCRPDARPLRVADPGAQTRWGFPAAPQHLGAQVPRGSVVQGRFAWLCPCKLGVSLASMQGCVWRDSAPCACAQTSRPLRTRRPGGGRGPGGRESASWGCCSR